MWKDRLLYGVAVMDAANTAVQWFWRVSSFGWSPNTWLGIGVVVFFIVMLILVGRRMSWVNNREPKKGKTPDLPAVSPQEVALNGTSDWMLEVLAFNQQHVYTAVKGSIVRWDFSGLKILEGPHFDIHLTLINTSIFTLDLKGVEGTIKVEGIPCYTKPIANTPQTHIVQQQEFYVVVTQPVLREMSEKILAASDNRQKINFDLNQLELDLQTTTKNYEGLKPRLKFETQYTPDIAAWLSIQGNKLGYWA